MSKDPVLAVILSYSIDGRVYVNKDTVLVVNL